MFRLPTLSGRVHEVFLEDTVDIIVGDDLALPEHFEVIEERVRDELFSEISKDNHGCSIDDGDEVLMDA